MLPVLLFFWMFPLGFKDVLLFSLLVIYLWSLKFVRDISFNWLYSLSSKLELFSLFFLYFGFELDLKLTDWYNSSRSLLLGGSNWTCWWLWLRLEGFGEGKRPFIMVLLGIFLTELMEKGLLGLNWSCHLILLVFFCLAVRYVSSLSPLILFLMVVISNCS